MYDKGRSLLEYWAWEPRFFRIALCMLFFIPVLMVCATYPVLGIWSLLFLSVIALGVMFAAVYGVIGMAVARIRANLPPSAGSADCVIVHGFIQSPGVAMLDESQLSLTPIVGSAVTVPLAALNSIRETHWFNGTYYLKKTGLWLDLPGQDRLGFAVASSVARQWRQALLAAKPPVPEPQHPHATGHVWFAHHSSLAAPPPTVEAATPSDAGTADTDAAHSPGRDCD